MSVRKREWTTSAGGKKTAWLVDYRDPQGKRRAKQFSRKKDADDYLAKAGWEVRLGVHTADSQSITVAAAGLNWLARAEREGLEASTIAAYRQHVRLHIDPFLGARRLNQLTRPIVETYRDGLLAAGRSKSMVGRVLRSLSAIVGEAQRVGYVAQNVAAGVTVKRGSREKPRVIPPSKEDMRALIQQAGDARPMDLPLLLVLIFTGLRASEIRALGWKHIDLKAKTLTVDRRADFKNVIGPPKSAAGRRTIPMPELLVSELRKWKLRCPPSALDLVFPSQEGTPIFHANLVLGFLEPIQIKAGVAQPRTKGGKLVYDDAGAAVLEGRYTLHCFRHAAASMWIEQRVAPKRVQSWMGHSSIQVTFDTYGHLFAALDDDAAVMAALESGLMGANATQMQQPA